METRADSPGLFRPRCRGEVRAMSFEQCWALNADRSRCEEPAADGQFFCEEHDVGYGLDPIDIFCLPEPEMPPALVAYIRECCHTWPFPAPSPPIVTFGLGAPAAVPAPLAFALREPAPAPPAAPPPAERALKEPEPGSPVAPPPAETDAEPESLAWLMAALRHSIEEVMAADVQPQQRASTVVRLGSLYLRAYRATELRQENRHLRKEVAALAARLADAETPVAAPGTRRKPPAGSRGGGGNSTETEHDEPRAASLAPGLTHDPRTLIGGLTTTPGASMSTHCGVRWLDTAFLTGHAFSERPRGTRTVIALTNPILSAAQREKRKQASALQRVLVM